MDSGLGADREVTEALFAPLSNELALAALTITTRLRGKIFAGSVTHPGPETPCPILQLRNMRLQGPSSLLETWTLPRRITKITLAKGKNQQCGVPASRKKNVLHPNKTELAAELLIPCLKTCIFKPTLLFWTLLLCRRILGFTNQQSRDGGTSCSIENMESIPVCIQPHWGSTAPSAARDTDRLCSPFWL